MIDYRVLYQYLDNHGHPRFEFTTVLADDAADAEAQLRAMRGTDYGLQIVQVVESNGASTGYVDSDYQAARDNAETQRVLHPRGD
jgi:hypothetical protein